MSTESAAPRHILEVAFAFRRSKILLAAVELGLFKTIGDDRCDAESIAHRVGLHDRSARNFLDALVESDFLSCDSAGLYSNTPESKRFLDPNNGEYIGDTLHRLSTRVYGNWNGLTSALRTGQPQSGAFGKGGYGALYSDPTELEAFLRAMTGSSLLLARALALTLPWDDYRSIVDIGTAEGCIPVQIAATHPHLTAVGFDLPEVENSFRRYVARNGQSDRVQFRSGDFFRDPLPSADVIVMSRVLHNWSIPVKQMLLRKAYAALPERGALIVCEALLDDARKGRLEALLASLHMLVETADGGEATSVDYTGWLQDAGFRDVKIVHLGCVQSAIIATKT
jgi:hypothetical protein